MIIKLKSAFVALSIFTVAVFMSNSAVAASICESLEECQLVGSYLQEQLAQQGSEVIRAYLRSQLTQVEARLQELLQPPETRTTTTGAVFTRDTSNASLGEAWRDPDGLIWGDIVKEDESVRYMVHSSQHMKEFGRPLPEGTLGAKEYCKSIGARLPSKEEFIRLREYMGAQSGTHEGYSAQVLPNLSGYWFWSSSVDQFTLGEAYRFEGRSGEIYGTNRGHGGAVLCVVSR